MSLGMNTLMGYGYSLIHPGGGKLDLSLIKMAIHFFRIYLSLRVKRRGSARLIKRARAWCVNNFSSSSLVELLFTSYLFICVYIHLFIYLQL
ncbi:hypothetical protein HanIR_Chr14g0685351 [Helianthus annuus]|nr:hypothetical protein HanIR_Chr14g0685351 [Helianthus annuus]